MAPGADGLLSNVGGSMQRRGTRERTRGPQIVGGAIIPDVDGSRTQYTGDWFNDVQQGYGLLEDGKKNNYYTGDFEAGLKHGSGILVWNDRVKSDGASRRFKRKYEGAFENDKMHGFGVLNQRDGSKYEVGPLLAAGGGK